MTRTILAAIAAAAVLFAAPALAQTKKSKRASAKPPSATVYQLAPVPAGARPYAVYSPDGVFLGADPDPFIRMMIQREGKHWEHTGP
jgi:hypothetical protein